MTNIPVGDRGQRYEVRYTDDDGIERVFGWADNPGPMVQSITLHPSMNNPQVIDRLAAQGGAPLRIREG